MDDQLSAIALDVAALDHKADVQTSVLRDLVSAFAAFTAGQARIMELLDMANRQLAALNQAVAHEPDSENLGQMLRALLVQLDVVVKTLSGLPHAVAAEVVLETDGLVLPPK